MYTIVFQDDKYWIACNGEILEELGGFIEPVSPQIIIKEISDEV